ncbi:hypothetical protein [Leptotrichia trevisanii]|uniref:hypothetical protein n=1 Tax=Leptotrichia trevisanii TaxID=109328 RepID=UPI0026EE2A99|nr:hypothetical protein [Leptotrichia trevisanii]
MSFKSLKLKNLDTNDVFDVNIDDLKISTDSTVERENGMGKKVTLFLEGEDNIGQEFCIKYEEYPPEVFSTPEIEEGNFKIVDYEFYNENDDDTEEIFPPDNYFEDENDDTENNDDYEDFPF